LWATKTVQTATQNIAPGVRKDTTKG
ncbi:MAG TPA: tRNA (guanosine(37)-N1)-methyltransferase TrmD, partial [Afipia sp.]|nr:tRNA (guanosine(37)-N1)-methyltransferase TrmD [Afipia sp.]